MKKKITIAVLALLMSVVAIGCNNTTTESTYASTVSVTSADIDTKDTTESKEEDDLLPFGFTPKEFHTNFVNFASFSDIITDDLQKITNATMGFSAHSASGEEVTILMLSNSKGKTISISVASKDVKKESFPDFAKAILAATDMLLDYDELDETLNFSKAPQTIDDFRYCNSYGISLTLSSTGFNLIRDVDSPDDYSYTTIHSNPKKKDESKPDSPESNTKTASSTTELTMGEKNALNKAHDYLNYSAFSYSGLLSQLEYEGFSTEEATYAVDNCGANWKEQAEQKALDYLGYSSFSYSGLIKQLEYEGFSTEEATYAADNCSADWNEQAAQKAQDYLNYSSFSRSGLIEQLQYEGFTKKQAEYGATAAGY